jgi:hypothetical protein
LDRIGEAKNLSQARNAGQWVYFKAFRGIQGLSWDTPEDYLLSKQEQLWAITGHGCEEGFRQFLDDKTHKPGLVVYRKSDKKQVNLRVTIGSIRQLSI